jgi:geranylgeranyl reductase family protein
MNESYDVIVCGAGPAGASAAVKLAGAGAKTLLIDRSTFPRDKLCGGALTEKSMRLLERVFGDTPEDLEAAGAVDGKNRDYAIRHLDEDVITGRLAYPLHFANRRTLDNRLFEHALAAGAKARQGDPVRTCDAASGTVETGSGRKFTGRWVIGADGAASTVRRAAPADRDRWRAGMATGVEAVVEPQMFPEPQKIPVLHLGFINAGYGWVFPTGHGVVTGVCGLNRLNDDFMGRFRDYLEFLGVSARVEPSAHILPYGEFLKRPVHGRVLLAGDAAGFADCLLGEGIYYALRSGEAAASAVLAAENGGPPVEEGYPRELEKDVLAELRATKILRRVLFRHQNKMRPRWPLVPLMRMLGDRLAEMVQGERSFRWGVKRDLGGRSQSAANMDSG